MLLIGEQKMMSESQNYQGPFPGCLVEEDMQENRDISHLHQLMQ